MIGYFAVEAKYAMKLDIYRVQISQDPNSGEIRRQWAYTETVPCLAKSIISTGVRSPSSWINSNYRWVWSNTGVRKYFTEERYSECPHLI